MGRLLDLSAQILAGSASIEDHDPFAPTNEPDEVAPGVAFVQSFANVAAVTTGRGPCLVDTGSPLRSQRPPRRTSPKETTPT